jgi:hypothetical protein
MKPVAEDALFKQCTGCGKKWRTRDEFLRDPEVRLVGYQANFTDLEKGFFMFNHLRTSCQTTLGLSVGAFSDLYDGPIFETHTGRSPDCPEYCLHEDNLDPCPKVCECLYVRAVMQKILRRPGAGWQDGAWQ